VSSAYRTVPGLGLQPAVEVELIYGPRRARTVGILDSGATWTIFSREYAAILGIEDISSGRHDRATTLGGPVDFYFFDLEVRLVVAGASFSGQVGFAAGHLARNLLGRNLVFSRFEIGFRETAQRVHLRPEE